MSFSDFIVFYTTFGFNSRLVDYSHKVDKAGKAKAKAYVVALAQKLNAKVSINIHNSDICKERNIYQVCASKRDLNWSSNLEADVGCAYLQVLALLMNAAGIRSLTELKMVLDLYTEESE